MRPTGFPLVPGVVCVLFGILAVAGTSCRRGPVPSPAADLPVLRVIGPEPASSIAAALTRRHLRVRVTEGAGGSLVYAVQAVRQGDADIGVAFADAAYTAHIVDGDRSALRAIASLPATPVVLLAHPRAGISRMAALRGHRVRLTSPASGEDPRFRLPFRGSDPGAPASPPLVVSSLSELIAGAFGLHPADLRVANLQPAEGLAALRAGTLDAYFTASGDDAPVREATAWGARLVPIEGPPVDDLRQRYPFIQPIRIPPGTYARQTATLHTVGVGLVLICRAGLHADVVYQVTRALTQEVETATGDSPLTHVRLDRAPVTPIPLHPGAARFYREWELFR